jgi:hypothetical protein
MIAGGLLAFAGCESMTGEGILEYYEISLGAAS